MKHLSKYPSFIIIGAIIVSISAPCLGKRNINKDNNSIQRCQIDSIAPLNADSLSYEALIDSAESNANRGDWSGAAELYRCALRKNPATPLNSKIFANLGLCLSRSGQLDEALEAYSIALIKEPESTKILQARATTLLERNDITGAEEDLEHVLRLDSLNSDALRMHGQIMLLQQNLEKALEDFRNLTKANPEDEWGYAGMGETMAMQGNHKDAIPLFSKALTLKESADFRISHISSLLALNRLSDAENAIRESIVLYPQTGEFYLLRAVMHKKLHQNRQAEEDKKYAVEYGVDPQTVEKYMP